MSEQDRTPVLMPSGTANWHDDGGLAYGWSVRSRDGKAHASTDTREDAIRILAGWYLIDLHYKNLKRVSA